MSADTSGLDRLVADLAHAGITVPAEASVAVRKTAHDIIATAQQLVPVDTGATRASIGADFGPAGLSAVIGPTTEYAPHLEYGTSRMAPRAFMGPALDVHTPAFVEAVRHLGGRIL